MNKILKCCLSVLLVISLSIPSNILFATKKAYAAESGTSVSSYEISYGVDSAWDGAFNAHINIKNISSAPIKNWCLEFSLEQEITNIWNAEIADRSNGKYVLNNLAYNRTIQPGETVGVGFTVDGDSSFEPTDLKLIENTSRNNLSNSECEIQFDVYSDWGSGFSGAVAITNISSKEISDWSLEFDFIGSIDSLWNGNVISKDGNHFVVENAGYNDLIKPGDSVTVGFNASRSSNDYPTNFLINCAWLRSETTQVFEVIFDCLADDAFNLPEKQIVISGEAAVEPNSPSRVGYSFAGWFLDSSCSSRFDFSIPIENNTILYAGWMQIYDNLTDDIIDLGDIEYFRANGSIEVTYDYLGQISSISGDFYNKPIESPQDFVDLLNASSALWANDFYASIEEVDYEEVDLGHGKTVYYTYNPIRAGAKVRGSEIKLMVGEDGKIEAIFNNYEKSLNSISMIPTIETKEATDIACNALMESEDVKQFVNKCYEILSKQYGEESISKEEIIEEIINSTSIKSKMYVHCFSDSEQPRLVYEIELSNLIILEADNIDESVALSFGYSYYVLANGNAGQIYRIYSNKLATDITAKDNLGNDRNITVAEVTSNGIKSMELIDGTRNLVTCKSDVVKTGWFSKTYVLPGSIVSFDSAKGPEKVAVSVHANVEDVFDYYKSVLKRNSYDRKGGLIISSYDYYDPWLGDNAFWSYSLQQFAFTKGSGLEKCKDVVAHEFTHAVISYVIDKAGASSGLTYYGESGALNEAYADIMGCLIEGKTGVNKWLIGEDSGSADRDIQTPSNSSIPHADNYSNITDSYWNGILNNIMDRDYEGVHIFSTIFSHAACLMMMDSRTSSVASDKWAMIFYESLFNLSANATFLDARESIIAIAKQYGLKSSEQQAIKDAFDAVGIVEPETVNIVLTWGENPRDLDSYLVGPKLDGTRFILHYGNTNIGTAGTIDWQADLDYDDTSSFGPEVTTIRNLVPGTYYFYVKDFTNRGNKSSTYLSNSKAEVKVYVRGVLSENFKVLANKAGYYWNVCKIEIDSSGNVAIESIETITSTEDYH